MESDKDSMGGNGPSASQGTLLESKFEPQHSPGAPLQDIYEVEKVLAVRHGEGGKREFLLKWKGWGHAWNNWEPEEHILDTRMLQKFNKSKKRPAIDDAPVVDDLITVHSKRRCAKHAAVRARLAARKEDGDCGNAPSQNVPPGSDDEP